MRRILCMKDPKPDSFFLGVREGFLRDEFADGDGDGELSGFGVGLGDEAVAFEFVTSATLCAGFHKREATVADAIKIMTPIIESSTIC